MIKKLVTLVVLVVAGYFLYQAAVWGYNELVDYSSIERGRKSEIRLFLNPIQPTGSWISDVKTT